MRESTGFDTAMQPHLLFSYLMLTASMTLVGSYVALSKPLLTVFPVFVLAALRFGIAALAMAPWVKASKEELPLSREEHRWLFLTALFGYFLFSVCMLYGIERTTASAAGIVLATLPAMTALLAWWSLRESLSVRALLAIALAAAGITTLHQGGADGHLATQWQGASWLLGAVLCEALYVILGKRLSRTRSPMRIAALINLWGLVLSLPAAAMQATTLSVAVVPAWLWALLVFYALAASLFAPWFWLIGIRRVAAHQAGIFTVALPITTTAIGVWALGEPFNTQTLVGVLCAAAAVVLVTYRRIGRQAWGG